MHTSRYIIYGVRFGPPPIYNICIYMCVYVEIKRSDRADATWRPSPTLVGTFAVACNLVLVHCCACSILLNDFVYLYIYILTTSGGGGVVCNMLLQQSWGGCLVCHKIP